MIKVWEIDENCNTCDTCGAEFQSLDDIVIDAGRGCICPACERAFTLQGLMDDGVLSLSEHYKSTID